MEKFDFTIVGGKNISDLSQDFPALRAWIVVHNDGRNGFSGIIIGRLMLSRLQGADEERHSNQKPEKPPAMFLLRPRSDIAGVWISSNTPCRARAPSRVPLWASAILLPDPSIRRRWIHYLFPTGGVR